MERRPADEVVYTIANRPVEQHRDAYRHFGHLTVTALRKFQQLESGSAPAAQLPAPGRPRNYTLTLTDDKSPIATIMPRLTAQQWKRRGGDRAFWHALKKLMGTPEVREKLHEDLS